MYLVRAKKMLSNPTPTTDTTSVNHIFIKVENKLVKIVFKDLLHLKFPIIYIMLNKTQTFRYLYKLRQYCIKSQ